VVAVTLLSPLDHRLRDNAVNELTQDVDGDRALVTSLDASVLTRDNQRLRRAARTLRRRTGADIAVFNADGRLLVQTDRDARPGDYRSVPAALRTRRIQGSVSGEGAETQTDIAIPASIDGQDITLAARKPLQDLQSVQQVVSRAFVLAAAAGLVGALLAGLLLDVALGPGSPDGYEVCRELRDRRNGVPIIMLTAMDSEADAVVGLEAGADDYVIKPFRPAELRSRIRAVLRRTGPGTRTNATLTVGTISLDPGLREVTQGGAPVPLTFSEFELLHALMAHRDRVHGRHDLLRAIWGESAYRDPRAIDVHVRHLREKLEAVPEEPRFILTVRGAGYRIGEP
jgi:DNA-binding response OmpR family regulator